MYYPIARWARRIGGFIGLLVLIWLFAGCRAGRPPASPTATPIPTTPLVSLSPVPTTTLVPSPTPAPPLEVRYGEVEPMPQVQPWRDQDGDGIMHWWPLVWESLLEVAPANGALVPGLASAWEVSADGMTIRFILRPDVRWHDGIPFRAEDVVATLRYFASPASHSLWRAGLLGVREVRPIPPLVIEVQLAQPDCAALYRIGQIPILPASAITAREAGAVPADIPGTGPMVLAEAQENGEVVLHPFRGYYGEPAVIQKFVYRPFASPQALQEAWEAGMLDAARFPAGSLAHPPSGVSWQVLDFPGDDYVLVYYNLTRRPLRDVNVRKALAMALDRAAIARQASPMGATLLEGTLLPAHWVMQATSEGLPTFDPHQAGNLLTAAGWTDADGDGLRSHNEQPLVLNVVTNGGNLLRMATAALVAQAYRNVGVESEVHYVEWGVFLDQLFRRDFDVAVLSWPFPLDPDQRMFWLSTETRAGSGFNFAGWENMQSDELLQQAAGVTACDPQARARIYGEWMRLLRDELPVVPLFVPHEQLWLGAHIGGAAPNPFAGPLWNVPWWHRQ
ncbi:MAG: ABC transporter substrate-binding protein [Anaerolineae bacterium]